MKKIPETRKFISLVLTVALICMYSQAGASEYNPFPFGFLRPGGQQSGPSAATSETTELKSYPSARSIKSGSELTIEYDLMLSSEDEGRISTIEEGTTLEYYLSCSIDEKEENSVDGPVSTVNFSMNRNENEKCVLTLHPTVEKTSTVKVHAKMIFRDGTFMENTTDTILVYTEEEIRSHVYTQACAAGEQIQVEFMVLGPEGPWRFTLYASYSFDGGKTYTRADVPLQSFSLNSRAQEPHQSLWVPVSADSNCMYRIETEVELPDGTSMVHYTDAVRVNTETVSL